jgi:hypothetical protein
MSAEGKRAQAALHDIERVVRDGYAMLDVHVDEWRLKGRSSRSVDPDDQLVYQHELHEAGPFMATADSQGKVGQWVVQLARTRVTELLGTPAAEDAKAAPRYSRKTNVQLQIFDESGPLDPFVDPLAPVTRTTPTMLAELATICEISKGPTEPQRGGVNAHGMSELEIAAAYEEQVFCLGWLKACFTPPGEAVPAAIG